MALSGHTTGTGIGVASGVRQSAQLLSELKRHRTAAWRAIRCHLDGARDDADALDCGFGLGSRGRDFAIGLDAGVHGLLADCGHVRGGDDGAIDNTAGIPAAAAANGEHEQGK
jgi:hypothetical protein